MRPENRLDPSHKPAQYNERDFELLLRYAESGRYHPPASKWDPLPNAKTDTNNHGAVSTDFIGMNWEYPEGDYATRPQIVRDHEIFTRGYSVDPAEPSARARGAAPILSPVGLAQGRIPGERSFSHAALHPRGPPHGGRRGDDGASRYRPRRSRRFRRHGRLQHGLAQRAALHHSRRLRAQRGQCAGGRLRAVPHQLSRHRAAQRRGREPIRSCLPFRVAHRLRQYPHGARVHDARPVRPRWPR